MLRTRPSDAIGVGLLIATVFVCPVAAQHADSPGALFDMPLPGGLNGAMQAVGDPAAGDPSQFLLDVIRRVHKTPGGDGRDGGEPVRSLLAYLDLSLAQDQDVTRADQASVADRLPLPLPPAVWSAAVFGGRATPRGLVGEILQSRNASLLYYGLLSLDDDTRAWLAGQPDLVADISSRHAAAFVLAAPALRVAGGALRVPGGPDAALPWEALVGARVSEPAAFIRALLGGESGLTYFYGSMAPLTAGQVRFALELDARDPAGRVAAADRLLSVFRRIAVGWNVHERTFWRPALDPALLVADLRVDTSGRPMLPGTQRFWSLAFARSAPRDDSPDPSELLEGTPVGFGWLCEQVFRPDYPGRPRRYQAVLFASRLARLISPANAADTLVAIRAPADYPALAAALDRAGLDDPAVVARAARRAWQLSDIRDEGRAVRAIAQFQGTLAIMLRAASRLAFPRETLAELVSSLASVNPTERGDYEGALVQWIDTHLGHTAGRLDSDLVRLVAGRAPADSRPVEWEGTRYRVDHAQGEATRVSRLLGEGPPPYMASSVVLVAMADAFDRPGLTPEQARHHATALAGLAQEVGLEQPTWWSDAPSRYGAAVTALERITTGRDVAPAPVLARVLRVLADDLLARGLVDLSYAAALGEAGRAGITAGEVARRHAFDLRPSVGRGSAWELPTNRTGVRPGMSVVGSLLGLELAFAELSLVRVSPRPPPRPPMLTDVNRRAFVEAVALVGSSLTDGDRDAIVSAIRKGRQRVAAIATPQEATALAEELRLSPARAGLLRWLTAKTPARTSTFLSTGELLRLGLGEVPDDSTLHAWGAPAAPRYGCLCLELPRREPWEIVAGRWGSGMIVSTFPDLNLRLAELLAEMQMPASLLGPVLAAATLDLVNTAISRDEDDRRSLVEYVNALDRERLEQYLALLTTDGPLVPLDLMEDTLVKGVPP